MARFGNKDHHYSNFYPATVVGVKHRHLTCDLQLESGTVMSNVPIQMIHLNNRHLCPLCSAVDLPEEEHLSDGDDENTSWHYKGPIASPRLLDLLNGDWFASSSLLPGAGYQPNWYPWGKTKLFFQAHDGNANKIIISGQGTVTLPATRDIIKYSVSGNFDVSEKKVTLIRTSVDKDGFLTDTAG